jgi:predicted DNA-binding protein
MKNKQKRYCFNISEDIEEKIKTLMKLSGKTKKSDIIRHSINLKYNKMISERNLKCQKHL